MLIKIIADLFNFIKMVNKTKHVKNKPIGFH